MAGIRKYIIDGKGAECRNDFLLLLTTPLFFSLLSYSSIFSVIKERRETWNGLKSFLFYLPLISMFLFFPFILFEIKWNRTARAHSLPTPSLSYKVIITGFCRYFKISRRQDSSPGQVES